MRMSSKCPGNLFAKNKHTSFSASVLVHRCNVAMYQSTQSSLPVLETAFLQPCSG